MAFGSSRSLTQFFQRMFLRSFTSFVFIVLFNEVDGIYESGRRDFIFKHLSHQPSSILEPITASNDTSIPQIEQDTLLRFFNNMGGQFWTNNSGWDILLTNATSSFDQVCTNWFGVNCIYFDGESHILDVILPQNNLQGTLPQLSNLTYLRQLDLSNDGSKINNMNNIRGDSLVSLCNLKHIMTIKLGYNNISSIIPKCFETLTMITSLDLSYNLIEGAIIDEICSLSLLVTLKLSSNRLRGSLPDCLNQNTLLEDIDLSSYDVNGAPFGVQSFTGTIPDSFCKLRYLVKLELGFTQGISGPIPSCLALNQSYLSVISFEGNGLTGSIPEALCSPHLQLLLLYQNKLSGTIPACLGSSSNLLWLALSVNSLVGTIPSELCEINALMDLSLDANSLVGAIPSCVGNLTNLLWISLAENKLHGTMPASLCHLENLVYLIFYSNHLSGAIDPCFAVSFPKLQILYLQDLDLGGLLPSHWNLPALNSLFLSNNKQLRGTLPGSLFHQQQQVELSHNLNLKSIVIEGTQIGGSLSVDLCLASQLEVLSLSGNELTGKLPHCICELKHVETLRLSRNQLSGTIPASIGNMTSLTSLDLSENQFNGRIPNSLGDLSPQLTKTLLDENYLSCDVPPNVRAWKPQKDATLNIYAGNLFGCGSVFAQSIQHANGLQNANKQDFESYGCGYADYVLPFFSIILIAIPIGLSLVWLFLSGRMNLQWCRQLSDSASSSSLRSHDLMEAVNVMRRLVEVCGLGVLLASMLMLLLIFEYSSSPYECQYMSRPTLGNKSFENHSSWLSFFMGLCVSMGLVSCISAWLLGSRNLSIKERSGSIYEQEEDEEEEERLAEGGQVHEIFETHHSTYRILKLIFLGLSMAVLSIGPNVAYVLLILSSSVSYELKVVGELLITLMKMILSAVLIPYIARMCVNEAIQWSDNISFIRFRWRIIATTLLLALTLVILPLCVVGFTHEECLYYDLFPLKKVTTQVDVEVCFQIDESDGNCKQYTAVTFNSTYTPSFQLNGETCLSSILSVYVPIYISSIILIAVIPAAVELIFVPLVVPWCARYQEWKWSQLLMFLLRKLTWNIPCVIHEKDLVFTQQQSSNVVDIDYFMQRVVERGFVAIICTVLLALTFGIAAPLVGVSCFIAAIIQLVHHLEVMGQLVNLSLTQIPPTYPNLESCCSISYFCLSIIVSVVLLVWVGWLIFFEWSWERFLFIVAIVFGTPFMVLFIKLHLNGQSKHIIAHCMATSKKKKNLGTTQLDDINGGVNSSSLTHSLIKDSDENVLDSARLGIDIE